MNTVEVDKLVQVIDLKIQKAINAIHTTSLGKIVKYYPLTMRADVELLENIHFKGKFYKSPIIVGCLIAFDTCGSFYKRIPYDKGDKVVVGFCESAIDEIILDGNNRNQVVSRRHSEDDAVILRGWKPDLEITTSVLNTKDWLLVNKVNGSRIIFKESGELEIDNGTIVKISPSGAITTTATSIDAPLAAISCLSLSALTTVDALAVSATTTVSGATIAAVTGLTVAGKEMSGHVHIDAEGRTTSTPV